MNIFAKLQINKLYHKTTKSLTQNVSVLLLCFVVFVTLLFTSNFLDKKLSEKTGLVSEYTSLQSSVTSLKSQKSTKQEQLSETELFKHQPINKDSFVDFIGKSTEAADIQLLNLTSGELTDAGMVKLLKFKLEMYGEINNIEALIKSIDALGTPYKVEVMSFRKDGKYLWLTRSDDDSTGLDWMQFDGKESITKDIQLPEALPDVVLNEYGEIVEIKDSLTSLKKLMTPGKVKMHLDIAFIMV